MLEGVDLAILGRRKQLTMHQLLNFLLVNGGDFRVTLEVIGVPCLDLRLGIEGHESVLLEVSKL